MKKTSFAILLFTAMASSAFAADQGFYLGADIGQSSTDTYSLSTKTGTAFSVLGGYQFMKYVGAEVQYNDFGSPTFSSGPSAKIDGYSAAVVGTLPFDDQWALLGKLGYAHTKVADPVNETKSDVTYGIAGQYNIDPSWGVRLNYDTYKVGSTVSAKTNVITVGALYRF